MQMMLYDATAAAGQADSTAFTMVPLKGNQTQSVTITTSSLHRYITHDRALTLELSTSASGLTSASHWL